MKRKDLERVLAERIQLMSPVFEFEKLPGGKISGSVISDTFNGMSDSDRQKRIWDALQAEWGTEATARVGTLLAYTPTEWNVNLADN